ncbi:response regulator [Dokdonia ponticola]|uniref:Response regulator n=1 Tax=Dokdonia ponticola TaxID=2041041 RepID=A0ABV9HUJ3_9FLAO
MFDKILIADDLGNTNYSVNHILREEYRISNIVQVQYCDDAHIKFIKAHQDKKPFELLITDLSFKEDHRSQNLSSGNTLISSIREIDSEIKIIVYSTEDRSSKINNLFKTYGIDGYVCKGRNGLKELLDSVKQVYNNQKYISPELAIALRTSSVFEIEEYDILLLDRLSNGYVKDEIAINFRKNNISPCSISSIEKRLNKLKIQFKAKNTIHLVTMVKDLGLLE